MRPRLSRLDPVANAARRFGADGVAEFLKGLLKLVLVGGILVWYVNLNFGQMIGLAAYSHEPAIVQIFGIFLNFLMLGAGVALLVGGADLLWQFRQHFLRNRMSRQDIVEEHREAEGDPNARAERQQRGKEIALNRMMNDVPKADVIIVNPSHYAVALKWTRSSGRPPICLAKGVDSIAQRIRSLAAENGVPVHSDPPTARAIYASVDVGSPIRSEHYRAVATALRLTESLRRRARRKG